MYPRIRNVTIRPMRLTPTEAELAVEMKYTFPQPTTELRGRLMGPTCLYSTTIEVAYPIRMLPRETGGPPVLRGRVVIPEPSWWDPQSPFLYVGVVELWEEGRKVEDVRVRCGLRHAEFGPTGLQWNGRPLELRAIRRGDCSADDLKRLREQGANLLIQQSGRPLADVLATADRLGMLVMFLVRSKK